MDKNHVNYLPKKKKRFVRGAHWLSLLELSKPLSQRAQKPTNILKTHLLFRFKARLLRLLSSFSDVLRSDAVLQELHGEQGQQPPLQRPCLSLLQR